VSEARLCVILRMLPSCCINVRALPSVTPRCGVQLYGPSWLYDVPLICDVIVICASGTLIITRYIIGSSQCCNLIQAVMVTYVFTYANVALSHSVPTDGRRPMHGMHPLITCHSV